MQHELDTGYEMDHVRLRPLKGVAARSQREIFEEGIRR
jgi:hypothetical protein